MFNKAKQRNKHLEQRINTRGRCLSIIVNISFPDFRSYFAWNVLDENISLCLHVLFVGIAEDLLTGKRVFLTASTAREHISKVWEKEGKIQTLRAEIRQYMSIKNIILMHRDESEKSEGPGLVELNCDAKTNLV